MKSDAIRLSVALVTRNRPESLARTLASLRAQPVQPWEIVVSDDSDPERVGDVAAVCARFGVRHVAGPRRGLYANRNHAALACHGTHMRSMDDDHEFPPGHMGACLKATAQDPDAVWFIGEFLPGVHPSGPPACPGQLHPRGFSEMPADPQDCWSISDGASIYPAAIFASGARFSESFKFGALYLEFGSLLRALGYRMRFLDRTYVVHHLDEANRSFMDAEMELAARLFAGLCHSFLYRPTLRNRFLCVGEIVRRTALPGGAGARRKALDAFHERRRYYEALAGGRGARG